MKSKFVETSQPENWSPGFALNGKARSVCVGLLGLGKGLA
jgi:hypothetical protein